MLICVRAKQALEAGEWLLVDNVNFCPPTVLDRLNGLLEPGGVLQITERGVVNGDIATVKPHPNFRLFFTMDPSFGEISRAMRNRGTEIACVPVDVASRDALSLLNSLGVAGAFELPSCVTACSCISRSNVSF